MMFVLFVYLLFTYLLGDGSTTCQDGLLTGRKFLVGFVDGGTDHALVGIFDGLLLLGRHQSPTPHLGLVGSSAVVVQRSDLGELAYRCRVVRRSGLRVEGVRRTRRQSHDRVADPVPPRTDLGLIVHPVEVEDGFLVTDVGTVRGVGDLPLLRVFQFGPDVLFLQHRRLVVDVAHPTVPFRWDLRWIVVVDVAGFHPPVCPVDVIHAVFVITVSKFVAPHVGAKLERVITVLVAKIKNKMK